MIGVLLYCLHPEILINYIDSDSSQNFIDLKLKKKISIKSSVVVREFNKSITLMINNLAFI